MELLMIIFLLAGFSLGVVVGVLLARPRSTHF